MKFKTLAIGAIAALLLAGCNNNTNPEPAPSPEPEPVGPVGPVVPTEWSSSIQTAMNQSLGFVLPFMVLSSSATFASLESQGYPGFYQISDSQSAGLLADYVALLDAADNLSDFEREADTSVPSVDYLKSEKTGETSYTQSWHSSEVYVGGSQGLSIVFGSSDLVIYTDWSPEQKEAMNTNLGEALPFFDGFTADDSFDSTSGIVVELEYDDGDAALEAFNDYIAKYEASTSGYSGSHYSEESWFGTDWFGDYSKPSEQKVGEKDAELSVSVALSDYSGIGYGATITITAKLEAIYTEWPAAELAEFLGTEITSVVPQLTGTSYRYEEVADSEDPYAQVKVLGLGTGVLDAYFASYKTAHGTVADYTEYYGLYLLYLWSEEFMIQLTPSADGTSATLVVYANSDLPAFDDAFPAESIATYFGIENEDLINEIIPFTGDADYGYKKGVYQDEDEGLNQFYVKCVDPAFGTTGDKLDVVYQTDLEGASYEITPATEEYVYTQAVKEIENVGRVFVEFYLDEETGVFEAYFEMSEAAAPVTGTSFVKVTSSADLVSGGNYLIVCESEGVAFDGSLDPLDAASNNIAVAISDNVIAATSELLAATFTITEGTGSDAGKYSVCSASGKYIFGTSGSNKLNESTDPAYCSVTIGTDGNADIESNTSHLRYNKQSGNERYRFYKSSSYTSQEAIQLYKLVTI